MHILKVDFKEYDGHLRITCPYCNSDQWGPTGIPSYRHECKEAGLLYLMNGYMFVDVPSYMFTEQQSTKNHG